MSNNFINKNYATSASGQSGDRSTSSPDAEIEKIKNNPQNSETYKNKKYFLKIIDKTEVNNNI